MSFQENEPILVIDTGLPMYTDKDVLIAKVVFDLLIKFFEEEKPDEVFDLSESFYEKEWLRLREIYQIVKSNDFFDNHFDEKVYQEVTDLLVEIMNLRYLLWT